MNFVRRETYTLAALGACRDESPLPSLCRRGHQHKFSFHFSSHPISLAGFVPTGTALLQRGWRGLVALPSGEVGEASSLGVLSGQCLLLLLLFRLTPPHLQPSRNNQIADSQISDSPLQPSEFAWLIRLSKNKSLIFSAKVNLKISKHCGGGRFLMSEVPLYDPDNGGAMFIGASQQFCKGVPSS